MKRLKKFFRYWVGRNRLAFGFCPECNSSPPQENCWVCLGTYNYGVYITPLLKRVWTDKWMTNYGR
jgi:hypothetical protein